MLFETMGKKFFPAAAPIDAPQQRLAWGLFWRVLATQSGVLFFAAALVCFFAYNWADIPAFAKFGFIAVLIAASALPAFLRGFSSSVTHAGLLLCGILGGVLFAVYGQVYQTGANAWELFRSWTFWLVPLFLISRRSGLFFTLWVVANLWASFYWQQMLLDKNSMRLFFFGSQTLVWAAFEAASYYYPAKELPFLRSRWIPRCIGVLLLACLTQIFIEEFIKHNSWRATAPDAGIGLLFLCVMGGGAYWYLRKKRDLFMIAAGLLSVIALIMMGLDSSISINFSSSFYLLFLALVLLSLSVAAGKFLIYLHGQTPETHAVTEARDAEESTPPPPEEDSPTAVLPSLLSMRVLNFVFSGVLADAPPEKTKESSPWVARLLMGICAWVIVPLLICSLVLFIYLLEIKSFSTIASISFFILAGGVALSRNQGIFIRQASLCTMLMASLALSVSLTVALGWEDEKYLLVPTIAVFAVSAFLARNEAYRFLAAVFVTFFSFMQLRFCFVYARRGWSSWGWLFRSARALRRPVWGGTSLLFIALFALLSVLLVLLWDKSDDSHPKLRWINRKGLLTALMVFGLCSVFMADYPLFGAATLSMCGVGAGIGLLVFSWRLSLELSLSKTVFAALSFLCLATTVASWWLPWVGVGLFALALARYAASSPLFGFSVIYLASCTVMEYYSRATTLLEKSKSLALAALVLVLAAFALQTLLTLALRKGAVSIPDELAEFCKRVSSVVRWESRREVVLCASLVGALVIFAGLFTRSVHQKETLLADGKPVILHLTPRDPRSLMQGDYMVLNLALEREIETARREAKRDQKAGDEKRDDDFSGAPREGLAVIESDAQGVYHFASLYDDALPLTEKQIKIIFRFQKYSVRVGSGSFFFREGTGRAFDGARYADLRVDENGQCLIVALRDSALEIIDPEKK
ncbi:MAG: GDYXXLXY domain-containing protein [Candidatus Accumulibacter sp.]|jgi:uncharacterized membrane protein/uncharacterized membrane-anchored protein|nr:GDYXXLXY domain-containing protein [Accumulibacter sp.]